MESEGKTIEKIELTCFPKWIASSESKFYFAKNEVYTFKGDRIKTLYIHTNIYIYIYANFIKHNKYFMPTYFLLDPFEFPYYFYRILGELI